MVLKQRMAGDKNLSEELVKFIDNLPKDSKLTIDDFFEHCGIPKKNRTYFVWGAICKGAKEIWDSRELESIKA